jgi:SAM-dependent methyltransferase
MPNSPELSKTPMASSKDYLWLHLRELPYFRALLRGVEARFYQDITLPPPTLDLGCGDGHFASIAFDRRLEIGLDPWRGPIKEAHDREVYKGLVQADAAKMPFPDAYFSSGVSNSVLEHIPQIDSVLKDTARVLKTGASFVFCVPNHRFTSMLSIGRAFDRIGLPVVGDSYRSFFNRISRHQHCDPPTVWKERLNHAGFQLVRWWHYFSPGALKTLEWGHYFGLPAWVSRVITGRWILSPSLWNLAITRRLVQPYYDEQPQREDGTYTFFIAQRQ